LRPSVTSRDVQIVFNAFGSTWLHSLGITHLLDPVYTRYLVVRCNKSDKTLGIYPSRMIIGETASDYTNDSWAWEVYLSA
jgi:hypothetical protein